MISIRVIIDIHIIINMNIDNCISYYRLSIGYSLLSIPYLLFPIGYSPGPTVWGQVKAGLVEVGNVAEEHRDVDPGPSKKYGKNSKKYQKNTANPI